MEPVRPDSKVLIEIVQTRMPYGKYKGTPICDLPSHYLEWMSSQGFPPGKLGMLLASVFEIKTNGLSSIITMVKNALRDGKL
jgi:uncharacterized protein (DUF3820 family)